MLGDRRDDPRALTNRRFVEGFDLAQLQFDPDQMRERMALCEDDEESYPWSFDPLVARRFRIEPIPEPSGEEVR